MKQEEIFQTAIHQFMEITGTGIHVLENKLIGNHKNNTDRLVELTMGNQNVPFWVKVKNEIREQNLPDNSAPNQKYAGWRSFNLPTTKAPNQ